MLFAHDTEPSLRAAVRLVNSAGEPDTLTTVAHLREFYDEEGYTGHKPTKRAELDDVRELRPRLRALLVASRDEVARRVNEILEESTVTPTWRGMTGSIGTCTLFPTLLASLTGSRSRLRWR